MEELNAIAQLKRGDLKGLETLMGLYYVKAVRTSYLIVGDPALAEDVVQSTFLNAKERIDQFDSNRPFGPWFLRSVVNASIKVCLEKKHLVSLDQESDWIEWTVDPNPTPEEQILTEERRQAIQEAIERLAPNQRAAIVLRYYLGLEEGEIATELKSPRSSVKWWLRMAKEKLKRFLIAFKIPSQSLAPASPPIRSEELKEEIGHE
jgi:RNA polymerase sigma-70 factor (ECF subfamily)